MDDIKVLEALAWYHLFGLVLALKKGRCIKALKMLTKSVAEELSKGPLEAHGHAHKGYGAIAHFIGVVRYDRRISSRRASPYLRAVETYTHTASFFWYQLQHLTGIPEYRDEAAYMAMQNVSTLITMEP